MKFKLAKCRNHAVKYDDETHLGTVLVTVEQDNGRNIMIGLTKAQFNVLFEPQIPITNNEESE